MIRNETSKADHSDLLTFSKREPNRGMESPLAHSKRDVRAFLNAAVRLKTPAPWTLALKARNEAAGSSTPLLQKQWSALIQELSLANAVGLFVSVREWAEVHDLESSLRKILGPKKARFSYPRINAKTQQLELAFCNLTDTISAPGSAWKSAPPTAPTVEPEVLFVPGLLMDTRGNRLGRGRGHYDRYLSQHPDTRRIGIIHSGFVVEEFSNGWIEEHDQSLEVLWTERGIFATPSFRPKLK